MMTLKKMTVGERVAVGSFGLTILTIVVSAAWWMSAMYSEVRQMRKSVETVVTVTVDHEKRISILEHQ